MVALGTISKCCTISSNIMGVQEALFKITELIIVWKCLIKIQIKSKDE